MFSKSVVFEIIFSNVDFFLPRFWNITSELPVRSPTQMRINWDNDKGKF